MKIFLYKDKTGRGIKNEIFLEDILAMDDDTDVNDVSLHEWAKEAEVGDNWDDGDTEYICIEND